MTAAIALIALALTMVVAQGLILRALIRKGLPTRGMVAPALVTVLAAGVTLSAILPTLWDLP